MVETNPDAVTVTLPWKEFIGYAKSIAAFKVAGMGNVEMTFKSGFLILTSDWGVTQMGYEGPFNGGVTVTGSALAKIARSHSRVPHDGARLKLRMEPNSGVLAFERNGIRGKFATR